MARSNDCEWEVRFDESFAVEAKGFARAAQLEIAALAGLLQIFGPQLRRPHCDTLKGSKHANMKELRFSLADGEWRVAFAFDRARHSAGRRQQVGNQPTTVLQRFGSRGGRQIRRTLEDAPA